MEGFILELQITAGVVLTLAGGVVKLWRDITKLQTQMASAEARLRKIDELKLEANMAEIKTELKYIRVLLEDGKR